jgi:hypothetical protein
VYKLEELEARWPELQAKVCDLRRHSYADTRNSTIPKSRRTSKHNLQAPHARAGRAGVRRAVQGLMAIASRRHTVAMPRSATQHRRHHTPKPKHHHNLQVPPQTRARSAGVRRAAQGGRARVEARSRVRHTGLRAPALLSVWRRWPATSQQGTAHVRVQGSVMAPTAQSRMREYELHLCGLAGEVGAAHATRRRRRVWLWPAR